VTPGALLVGFQFCEVEPSSRVPDGENLNLTWGEPVDDSVAVIDEFPDLCAVDLRDDPASKGEAPEGFDRIEQALGPSVCGSGILLRDVPRRLRCSLNGKRGPADPSLHEPRRLDRTLDRALV